MKSVLSVFVILALLSNELIAQEKGGAKNKVVRFNNITEVTVGFQLGKTKRITSFEDGESEVDVAGRKIPAPRVSSSFGVLIGRILFIGPGAAYTFQAEDQNNSQEHQISVFGHARLNFARKRIRPFIEFKGGYHFASFDELSSTLSPEFYKWDGFFLEPAFGMSFKLGDHALVNTSVGYQFVNAGNRIEQTIVGNNSAAFDAALNEKYHRFLISIGFTFQ